MSFEKEWDKKLNITTCEHNNDNEDYVHHAYEPTPYSVLHRLVESGYLDDAHKLIDYGCGLGRVGFYLNHELSLPVVGIDFVQKYIDKALLNKNKHYPNVTFKCIPAEKYELPEDIDTCYFFNPFDIKIFRNVINKILQSYYQYPRTIRLIFYFIDETYLGYLMNIDELEFIDEIRTDDLFSEQNNRECLMIFELNN